MYYVYFRLFKVAVSGFFKKRVRFLDLVTTSLLVWPNDLDFNFHVNNGRYLTLMDIGRFDLSLRAGLMRAVLRNRWFPVLATASIQFYRSLGPFQKFQLTTQVLYWDEKWLYLAQGFHYQGKVYASAIVKAVFKKGKQTIPVRDLFAFLGEEFYLPEMPKEISALGDLESNMESRRKTMTT
jgi:acyl-CoA thioesterase FadM